MTSSGKTLRLLFPDSQYGCNAGSGFVPRLLADLAPLADGGETVEVPAGAADEKDTPFAVFGAGSFISAGAFHEAHDRAAEVIAEKKPSKIVYFTTDGAACLAPVDYLAGVYPDLAVLWLDVHPETETPKRFWTKRTAIMSAVTGNTRVMGAEGVIENTVSPGRVFFLTAKEDDLVGADRSDFKSLSIVMSGAEGAQNRGSKVLRWLKGCGAKHLFIHIDIDSVGAADVRSGLIREGHGPLGGAEDEVLSENVKGLLEDLTGATDVVGLGIMDYEVNSLARFEEILGILRI